MQLGRLPVVLDSSYIDGLWKDLRIISLHRACEKMRVKLPGMIGMLGKGVCKLLLTPSSN